MSRPLPKKITQAHCRRVLRGVPRANRKAVLCSLVGHSLIVSGCFGYVYCGRGAAELSVRIGHNCATCRKNYKLLDWRHKWLTPNPFKKEKVTAQVKGGE